MIDILRKWKCGWSIFNLFVFSALIMESRFSFQHINLQVPSLKNSDLGQGFLTKSRFRSLDNSRSQLHHRDVFSKKISNSYSNVIILYIANCHV